MARLNLLNLNFRPRTHESEMARNISPELQLRRSVLACVLWESQFYEDGVEIAGRIAGLVPKVATENVAALAVEVRTKVKLSHAPLLLVREMARHSTHRKLVADSLAAVIQRADELAEFVAIYWKDGRVPLSAQVKKGWLRSRRSLMSTHLAARTVRWMCIRPHAIRRERTPCGVLHFRWTSARGEAERALLYGLS
jgi:60 kDa SS-A/Ro ribonucleoprotein